MKWAKLKLRPVHLPCAGKRPGWLQFKVCCLCTAPPQMLIPSRTLSAEGLEEWGGTCLFSRSGIYKLHFRFCDVMKQLYNKSDNSSIRLTAFYLWWRSFPIPAAWNPLSGSARNWTWELLPASFALSYGLSVLFPPPPKTYTFKVCGQTGGYYTSILKVVVGSC